MKKRLKTYSFWISLSGAIVVLVQAIGRVVGFIANANVINNIVMAVAGVLVVFGIVSAPTESDLDIASTDSGEENEESENESDKT